MNEVGWVVIVGEMDDNLGDVTDELEDDTWKALIDELTDVVMDHLVGIVTAVDGDVATVTWLGRPTVSRLTRWRLGELVVINSSWPFDLGVNADGTATHDEFLSYQMR